MVNHKIIKILPPDSSCQDLLSKELGISKILAQVLINRGIKDIREAEKFLNAGINDLLDPFSFSDMQKATELIKRAIINKERVMVFGDYDVDGITALALLKNTLKKMKADVVHYLPHRIKEGYGLTKNIVRLAKDKNAKILITVDCGISNHKQIEELRKNHIDTIITDHHENASSILPQAASIINPKVKGSNYKFRDLAGVGVAYKFCQALSNSVLLEDLDLVTLGTIADSVPLIGENRIIAKEGLSRFTNTKRPGLRALITSSRMNNKVFNSTHLSFIIGPRINASGRLDTAETSLKLLMSETEEEASGFARIIEAHNRERQKIEGKIMEEAEDIINKEVNFKEHKIIVIAKENWHQGVLGIVASKLADRFYRPAIVISINKELCKGSARSIKNFHLFQALLECSEFLDSFGGHSHAAGLLITKESIEDFKQSINRLAHEKMSLEDLLPSLDIDLEISLNEINEGIISELKALEPYGQSNPEPLFLTRSLRSKGMPRVLSRETLKFWVTDSNITFQAIGFGMSSFRESLISSNCFDLVYTPRIDSWQGEENVLLEVKDIFFR